MRYECLCLVAVHHPSPWHRHPVLGGLQWEGPGGGSRTGRKISKPRNLVLIFGNNHLTVDKVLELKLMIVWLKSFASNIMLSAVAMLKYACLDGSLAGSFAKLLSTLI